MNLKNILYDRIDAKRENGTSVKHVDIGINLESFNLRKSELEVNFTYVARYEPKAGFLILGGTAVFDGKPTDLKKAAVEWKNKKQVTGELGQQLINNLNYSSSMNAVFVSRVLNMSPPFLIPRLEIKK